MTVDCANLWTSRNQVAHNHTRNNDNIFQVKYYNLKNAKKYPYFPDLYKDSDLLTNINGENKVAIKTSQLKKILAYQYFVDFEIFYNSEISIPFNNILSSL
jgi:hypothetical protein